MKNISLILVFFAITACASPAPANVTVTSQVTVTFTPTYTPAPTVTLTPVPLSKIEQVLADKPFVTEYSKNVDDYPIFPGNTTAAEINASVPKMTPKQVEAMKLKPFDGFIAVDIDGIDHGYTTLVFSIDGKTFNPNLKELPIVQTHAFLLDKGFYDQFPPDENGDTIVDRYVKQGAKAEYFDYALGFTDTYQTTKGLLNISYVTGGVPVTHPDDFKSMAALAKSCVFDRKAVFQSKHSYPLPIVGLDITSKAGQKLHYVQDSFGVRPTKDFARAWEDDLLNIRNGVVGKVLGSTISLAEMQKYFDKTFVLTGCTDIETK